MSVVTAFEDAGPCRKRLTVEVPAPAVDAEVGRVTGELAREVRVQGFRKGKAPRGLIRRRYKEEIEKQVAERLVPRYWRQAQAEKSLDPLLPPEISELEIEDGAPMTFVAEVEVRPPIDLKLEPEPELPAGSAEPTEAELEEALEDLRGHHASWHPVERPAAVGDRVQGTVKLLSVNGEAPEEEHEEGKLDVELGDERVWEELNLALTGVTPGREVEFARTVPASEGGEEREMRYRATVAEVLERELPELDDALAAKMGDFETVDALRAALRERIGAGKREQLQQERRRALLDELRARHPLELPQRLVDQTTEDLMRQQLSHLAQQGIDLEAANLDWQGLAARIRPEAEKRVHERLLLDAVVEARDIKVDEAAFETLLASLAAQQKRSTLALRQELGDSGRMPLLRAQFQRDQAVRMLLGDEETDPDGAGDNAADEPSET